MTHVFIPFPDSNDNETLQLWKILGFVLFQSSVKMIACLLNKQSIEKKCYVKGLIFMGSIKLKARPRNHSGDFIYFYAHDGVSLTEAKLLRQSLSWQRVEQQPELASRLISKEIDEK